MSEILLVIVIGIIGGIAVGVQSPVAGAMSARVGAMGASLIIHVGGAIISGIALVLTRPENLQEGWASIPRPFFLAGVFGVILYFTLSYTLPRVGATTSAILLIAAQLTVSIIIDHFGWLGVNQTLITWPRLLGVLLVVGGAYLTSR